MSLMAETKQYAVEVAETALNGFERQARGDLEAPNGDENVRLFTAKGGSAITLASTTTSAAIVFDPEATLRKGQLDVTCYERNSSDAVTNVQQVNLGRATSEFISAGVLSSGLKVFNSSGVDVIGGTQTAAVLTSVPRDISTLTSTDVANFCANHERDLASGVVSREDSTMTMVMTEHFGKKMALSRSNTLGNVVKRTWDDGIGSRRTTTGQALTFTAATDMALGASAPADAAAANTLILSNDEKRLVDTARLDSGNNPLTLATYSVDAYVTATFTGGGVTNANQQYVGKILALDAADTVVAELDVNDRLEVDSSAAIDIQFSGTLTSSTTPIARVVIGITHTGVAVTDNIFLATTSARVSAYEETADIAARPIHVCVLEGLNASATINITSTATLTGVPDSTNVFISAAQPDVGVYDNNAVETFLRIISRALPRAFTVSGHAAVSKMVSVMYQGEEVDVAFKAMSFKDVSSALRKVTKYAESKAKDLPMLLDKVSQVGEIMSMAPGPVGAAGSMLSMLPRK